MNLFSDINPQNQHTYTTEYATLRASLNGMEHNMMVAFYTPLKTK
jgi:hypothetical protein